MNTPLFHKPYSDTCSDCGKPLYQDGDILRFTHDHFDYLIRELACTASEPPSTLDAMTEYLCGLRAYLCDVKSRLPEPETEEEEAEE